MACSSNRAIAISTQTQAPSVACSCTHLRKQIQTLLGAGLIVRSRPADVLAVAKLIDKVNSQLKQAKNPAIADAIDALRAHIGFEESEILPVLRPSQWRLEALEIGREHAEIHRMVKQVELAPAGSPAQAALMTSLASYLDGHGKREDDLMKAIELSS